MSEENRTTLEMVTVNLQYDEYFLFSFSSWTSPSGRAGGELQPLVTVFTITQTPFEIKCWKLTYPLPLNQISSSDFHHIFRSCQVNVTKVVILISLCRSNTFQLLHALRTRCKEKLNVHWLIRNIPDIVSLFPNPWYDFKLYFGYYRRVVNGQWSVVSMVGLAIETDISREG